jgi:hypothetical protein
VRLQNLVVGKDSEMEVKEVEAAEMVTKEEAAGMEDLSVGVVAYPHPFLLSLVSSTEEAVGSIPMAAEAIGIQEVIGNNPKKMINRRTPEALVIFSRPAN